MINTGYGLTRHLDSKRNSFGSRKEDGKETEAIKMAHVPLRTYCKTILPRL